MSNTENKDACGAGNNLEDLLSQLSSQINSSDWLEKNTPEKFAAENPEVAKAFQDAANTTKKDPEKTEAQKTS